MATPRFLPAPPPSLASTCPAGDLPASVNFLTVIPAAIAVALKPCRELPSRGLQPAAVGCRPRRNPRKATPVSADQTKGTDEMRHNSRSLAKALMAMTSVPADGRGLGEKLLVRRELGLVPTAAALFVARRLFKSANTAGEPGSGMAAQDLYLKSSHGSPASSSQRAAALSPRAAHVSALSPCASLQY